ncbi:translation elongation factor 4 [Buchnera aphidicola]|uniref:Elongation factor 4 n=1 Tax=Buchnera aphidicola subsp. Tuberolachnus salignus TaxID=98804 RepID=A0A160SYQ6_BUCTT|nr:translation elongation factor 4 [Buchnera aphidicola]CUR53151.1 Elongation factor 4 [Buchnera aphidicola (Tuberolachnus salignus)]
MKNIRNFSIIAHIDHGKTTLSDRLIQKCNGLTKREMFNQVLDSMDLERERGITIKAQSVTLKYIDKNKKIFFLNFIDTPGHVNFSHEVFRSLSACEGVLLVIDTTQGIEAQTIAHCNYAQKLNLTILPVLNKIDLPNSNPKKVLEDIKNIIKIPIQDAVQCSAKTGQGISELLKKIVQIIPQPSGNVQNSLQALIIDSWFDKYFGIVSLIRIKNGSLKKKDKILIIRTKKIYIIENLGIFTPKRMPKDKLYNGEVGWIIFGSKKIDTTLVGETITSYKNPSNTLLPKFKKIKPKIYAGLFPFEPKKYILFRDALNKLKLNDISLFTEPDNSKILGFGFRCGFLGLLHMEIVQSRLEREYNIKVISTAPTVIYEILLKNNQILLLDNPSKFPKLDTIKEIREPLAICHILTPIKYVGEIIKICIQKRGTQQKIIYHDTCVSMSYIIPLSEIILDFFDQLKTISSGYASLEYKFKKFKKSDLVKIDILINHIKIDSLSMIQHKKNALKNSKKIIEVIKKIMPRHQFNIPIQASISNTIIARTTIKQLRKNVIEKCYGGDISRKKKLLKQQKKGKKKMKQIGNVNIPQEVFFSIFQMNKNK